MIDQGGMQFERQGAEKQFLGNRYFKLIFNERPTFRFLP